MFTRRTLGPTYMWQAPARQVRPMSSTVLSYNGVPYMIPVARPLNAPAPDPTGTHWGLIVYPVQVPVFGPLHRGAGPALRLPYPAATAGKPRR
jgi:hypothetical protein